MHFDYEEIYRTNQSDLQDIRKINKKGKKEEGAKGNLRYLYRKVNSENFETINARVINVKFEQLLQE